MYSLGFLTGSVQLSADLVGGSATFSCPCETSLAADSWLLNLVISADNGLEARNTAETRMCLANETERRVLAGLRMHAGEETGAR